MKINFVRSKESLKSKAVFIGTLAFLVFPAGFGASLVAGATATIAYAAYKTLERKMEETALDENVDAVDVIDAVLEDKEFKDIAEPTSLYIVSGAIIALGLPGVVGLALTATLIVLSRKALHTIYSCGGRRETALSREWAISVKLDDKTYRFAI